MPIDFKHKIYLFICIFIFKYLTIVYIINLSSCTSSFNFFNLASYTGDANSYIQPIDNLLKFGTYSTDDYGIKPFAGRMPYYGLFYLPLSLIFTKYVALNLLVIIQLIVESISVLYLGSIAYLLFKNIIVYFLTILLYTLSLYTAYWSVYILPESLSVSFLIFSFYHLFKYLNSGKLKHLLYFSFFLVWLILLKPYYIPFLIIIPIKILVVPKQALIIKKSLKISILTFFNTTLLLLMFLAPWIIRNYVAFNKFIPLQINLTAGTSYTQSELKLRELIQAWGESIIHWDPRGAACYFYHPPQMCEYSIPSFALLDKNTLSELKNIRDTFQLLRHNYDVELDDKLSLRIDSMTQRYKDEKSFHFHIISRFLLIKNFLIHTGTYYIPISKNSECFKPWQMLIKLSQSILYYLALIPGLIGLGLIFKRNWYSVFLFTIPVYLIFLFCIVLRGPEFRYFLHAYPFLIIGLAYLIVQVFPNFTLPFLKPEDND